MPDIQLILIRDAKQIIRKPARVKNRSLARCRVPRYKTIHLKPLHCGNHAQLTPSAQFHRSGNPTRRHAQGLGGIQPQPFRQRGHVHHRANLAFRFPFLQMRLTQPRQCRSLGERRLSLQTCLAAHISNVIFQTHRPSLPKLPHHCQHGGRMLRMPRANDSRNLASALHCPPRRKWMRLA